MNESKKMTSIARKINTSFWFKKLFDTLGLNIVIFALIASTFIYWRYEQVPSEKGVVDGYFETGESYEELQFVLVDEEGTIYPYYVSDFTEYLVVPVLILFAFELIDLFFALFRTSEIRRKLRPLNDLAIKAEKLSSLPLDDSKFENLENAIWSLSPDVPDAKISTGDKDLMSIEVALNNLLFRMRESQKQQARFVSDASHELRTPISVIQGYVNMLDRWGKEDESILDESIEALKHESEHMKELIEQLLFLARGDSGRNTLTYSEIDMNEIIREVWEESLMIDSQHGYKFVDKSGDVVDEDGNIKNQPALMQGDSAMIKQSVRIFVQNAAKYSAEGDTITLRVIEDAETVSYVVQDEGIGMRDSEVVHIFERFYRSDEARNENTGGSGLGLSIAKWIIDAHDGEIDVLSRPDFGTRFTVTFKKNIGENKV